MEAKEVEEFRIIPALQRFYGGNPTAWFDYPLWILRLYQNEMPKLQARENLNNADVAAMGSGILKKEARQALNFRWRIAAQVKYKARKATLADLAAMGVSIKK